MRAGWSHVTALGIHNGLPLPLAAAHGVTEDPGGNVLQSVVRMRVHVPLGLVVVAAG